MEGWDKQLKALEKFRKKMVMCPSANEAALWVCKWLSSAKMWVRHGTDKKRDKNDTDVIELGHKLRKLGVEI